MLILKKAPLSDIILSRKRGTCSCLFSSISILSKLTYRNYVVFISIREQEKTELLHSKFIHIARFAGIFTI